VLEYSERRSEIEWQHRWQREHDDVMHGQIIRSHNNSATAFGANFRDDGEPRGVNLTKIGI
jgi:hypothetical protein